MPIVALPQLKPAASSLTRQRTAPVARSSASTSSAPVTTYAVSPAITGEALIATMSSPWTRHSSAPLARSHAATPPRMRLNVPITTESPIATADSDSLLMPSGTGSTSHAGVPV